MSTCLSHMSLFELCKCLGIFNFFFYNLTDTRSSCLYQLNLNCFATFSQDWTLNFMTNLHTLMSGLFWAYVSMEWLDFKFQEQVLKFNTKHLKKDEGENIWNILHKIYIFFSPYTFFLPHTFFCRSSIIVVVWSQKFASYCTVF